MGSRTLDRLPEEHVMEEYSQNWSHAKQRDFCILQCWGVKRLPSLEIRDRAVRMHRVSRKDHHDHLARSPT